MGNAQWYNLHVNGNLSPFFISKGPSYEKLNNARYRLLGRGMSSSGCARDFGWFRTIKEAKERAEKLSCIGGEDVQEFQRGNTKIIVGDDVTTKEDPGYFFQRKRGKVLKLMMGSEGCLALVQWAGESSPCYQFAPLLQCFSNESA